MAHKRNSVEVPELEKLLAGKKKKYVRYEEGAVLYSMGKNTFRQICLLYTSPSPRDCS